MRIPKLKIFHFCVFRLKHSHFVSDVNNQRARSFSPAQEQVVNDQEVHSLVPIQARFSLLKENDLLSVTFDGVVFRG